jgi:hypothetical protein
MNSITSSTQCLFFLSLSVQMALRPDPAPDLFSDGLFMIACVWTTDGNGYPGSLCLQSDKELVFTYEIAMPDGSQVFQTRINLIGLLETKIMPDPSVLDLTDSGGVRPGLLLVTYLSDPFDNSSNVTLFFNGIESELEDMQSRVAAISRDMQNRLLFQGPDLTPTKGKMSRRTSMDNHPTFQLINGESGILNASEINQLRLALPYRMRKLSWEKLYAATEHGVSLSTMFARSERRMPILMVILTSERIKLGAYLPTGLKPLRGYSGSGETFVFHFTPEIQVYRWSQKNTFFTSVSVDDIAVGGGSGSAIFLTGALKRGFSSPCDTFDSVMLTRKDQFDMIDVELWHVKTTAGPGPVRPVKSEPSMLFDPTAWEPPL